MEQFEAAYKQLNTRQREAVDITDGPVLVVAGAGTGKTRVIVDRVERLVSQGVDPSSILALTFTEKAASEMLDRVNADRVGVSTDITIATFNRFGNDLLSQYGAEWGLGTLRLLGDTGQLVFLREHFDELTLDYFAPVSNPDGQLEVLANYISLLKQQLVSPQKYLAYAKKLPAGDEAETLDKQKHTELARLFEIYLQLCRRQQVIDYDDQVYLTIQLLENRPNILKQLQERYKFILVDEFQDTNPMQSRLVDLLTGSNQNLMVVGDDDQSIYGWRGATLANILDFKKRYPEAKEVTLIENYRSSQAILDSAYRLIQHNNPHRLEVLNKLDKRLHAQTDGAPPSLKHFTSLEAELAWLASDIQRRLNSGQASGSIAVMTRSNRGIQKIHEALELQEVPHVVAGLNNDMYMQPTVRQLIEALKAIADPNDDIALFHTLSGPLFNLAINQVAELSADASRRHEPLASVLADHDDESIQAALQQIDNWREAGKEQSVGTLAYNIMTESGWKQQLYSQAEHDNAIFTEVQALASFFRTLKDFERISVVPSVQSYLVNLPVLQAAGNQFDDATLDISDTHVNVLSIHRAKGLEWDTVYITDCTESSFPLANRGGGLQLPEELQANPSEADEHVAEERRLMYVALTRARKDLVLSYSDRHGSGSLRKPSRFLTELLGHAPTGGTDDEPTQTNLELFAPPSATNNAVSLPTGMYSAGHFTLSVSQIECWLRCPQDFYYRYVLSMPLPPAPQLTYGSLIHSVIEKVHRGRQAGQVPSLEQLTEEVISNLPQVGYLTKQSRQRAHDLAPKTVHAVYERFLHDELPLETEWPFELTLPDLPLTIRGKIDAIYQMDKGIEIRDFKTGTGVRSAEQAKSRATSSQQLTLYAYAWQQLRGDMPNRLSLDFVETGQLASVKKQPKSLLTLHAKLKTMVEQLSANKFPAGHDHKYCMHPLT
ncbi:MAG TPA: ATP-dependent DNA helicase [Candidatus Saccharimonadales bacterium]|nr:ATP-dependent DNA helicase [Candidatus Saccharimonadales bacterium]